MPSKEKRNGVQIEVQMVSGAPNMATCGFHSLHARRFVAKKREC
jgi:hypothetical protein